MTKNLKYGTFAQLLGSEDTVVGGWEDGDPCHARTRHWTRVTLMCWTCEPREPIAKGDESLHSGHWPGLGVRELGAQDT